MLLKQLHKSWQEVGQGWPEMNRLSQPCVLSWQFLLSDFACKTDEIFRCFPSQCLLGGGFREGTLDLRTTSKDVNDNKLQWVVASVCSLCTG